MADGVRWVQRLELQRTTTQQTQVHLRLSRGSYGSNIELGGLTWGLLYVSIMCMHRDQTQVTGPQVKYTHCKDKMPKIETLKLKIWNKYSQKRNIGVSVPIFTFMCLWANYIFPRWVCLFCWRKYMDRSWEYINCSQTHECGNWGWGRAIPRKGIYKRNCRCSAYKEWLKISSQTTNSIFQQPDHN